MADFSELIRNFDKIRDYMHDFYIFGFRSRSDFTQKSLRTYDNEKRRIESYLGSYMRWDYGNLGKNSFISMDCAKLSANPLYAAWKAKAFTSNDIMLHFYLLDILNQTQKISIQGLTDEICLRSERDFDVQTVRNKCKEYVKLGMITEEKSGKTYYYSLSSLHFNDLLKIAPALSDAIKFFQGSAPFGEIGSFVMDDNDIQNDLFSFNHYYVSHTLEDEILLDCISAIHSHSLVTIEIQRNGASNLVKGLPLKIFVSAKTGRRYLCIYSPRTKRFSNHRLDYIKNIQTLDVSPEFAAHLARLHETLSSMWGVSFGKTSRSQVVHMKLFIDEEREPYILDRLAREGKGGRLQRLEKNIFRYTKEVAETSDIAPWLKTFTGRILKLSSSDPVIVRAQTNAAPFLYEPISYKNYQAGFTLQALLLC